MATAYIAHFYPQKDAEQFFQEGEVIQVLPPIFRSFAEAAKQIGEELSDIIEGGLPVSAYVLEVEKVDGGYEVIEAIEITQDEDDDEEEEEEEEEDDEEDEEEDFRYNNPSFRRRNPPGAAALPAMPASALQAVAPAVPPKAPRAPRGAAAANAPAAKAPAASANGPVGEVVGTGRARKVEMHQLDGIKVGAKRDFKVKEAADAFAAFMATRAPTGVSPRLITGAYNKKAHTKAHNEALQASADARKQAIADLRPTLEADVREGNIDQKLQAIDERIQEIQSKKKAGEIDPAVAAYDLSFENKRFEVLALLKAYCPPCAEDESTPPEELSFLRTKLRSTELKERQRAATAPMATRATARAPEPPPEEGQQPKAPKFATLDRLQGADIEIVNDWIDSLSQKAADEPTGDALLSLYIEILELFDYASLWEDRTGPLKASLYASEAALEAIDEASEEEILTLAGRTKYGEGTLKTIIFGKKTPQRPAAEPPTPPPAEPPAEPPAAPKPQNRPAAQKPKAKPVVAPAEKAPTVKALGEDDTSAMSISSTRELMGDDDDEPPVTSIPGEMAGDIKADTSDEELLKKLGR